MKMELLLFLHNGPEASWNLLDGVLLLNENPGCRYIPNFITIDSNPVEYFTLLSDENVWNLVPETDNEAIYVLMTKANHWVAAAAAQKKLETVEEIKNFIFIFDLQGMMDVAQGQI